MHLTKTIIDSAKYTGDGNSRDVRWDDDPRGLGVRVYPTGHKAFILSYRAGSRKRLLTLGDYGVLTLQQAREMAKRKLLDVLDGADPVSDRKRLAMGETIGELCTAYIEQHAKVHKKTWKEDERRLNAYVRPAWSSLKAISVTRADVATLHAKIGKHSIYEANRTLEVLSKMFGLASDWGVIPETMANPVRGVKRFKEKTRDRWVQENEMPRLATAIEQAGNIYVRAALWLYILTGVRKSELLKLRWSDIDFNRREIRLAETKNDRTHYVPLSDPALQILEQLPREEGNPHVFPGQKQGRHLVNIYKSWYRVRKNAGIEDVRLHDLRRTLGSMLAERGFSLQLIGKVLNHKSQSATLVYARLTEDQSRKALDHHGQAVMQIVSDKAAT